MEILTGSLYFVSDRFFAKINDPYLKINYAHTKWPHYFAFKKCQKIINLLHRGVRFTPTQPNAIKIEQMMLKELEEKASVYPSQSPE